MVLLMSSFWGNIGVFAVFAVIVCGYAKIIEYRGYGYKAKADVHVLKSLWHLQRMLSTKKLRPKRRCSGFSVKGHL